MTEADRAAEIETIAARLFEIAAEMRAHPRPHQSQSDADDLIDVAAAAELTGYREDTIRYLCRKLPGFGERWGGRWRVHGQAARARREQKRD